MSQFILQPFFHLSYVTGSSLMSSGEPPIFKKKFYSTKAMGGSPGELSEELVT